MATISDELAASIQKCFNQTYADLANQQNIFFGTGDVTITKPDGSKRLVPSWDKLNKSISNLENGGLQNKALYTGSIELSHATPYIDFHYGSSTTDYTHRIIAWNKDTLSITSGLNIEKNLYVSQWIDAGRTIRAYDPLAFLGMDTKDPQGTNGSVLAAPRFFSKFPGRGSDNYGQAGAAFWFEEYVGYNHKAVISVQGFSSAIQYFQFLVDGQIQGSRGYVQWSGTSDVNYKNAIKPTDGSASIKNICAMDFVTFIYNDDEKKRIRRGVIAQQIQKIDANYVKNCEQVYQENGQVVKKSRLVLDSTPLLLDALAAIKVLERRVAVLERQCTAVRVSDCGEPEL